MKVLTLGAGQEVGRSCIIVKIKEKTIMLDCGVHLGLSGPSKFPDFSLIDKFFGNNENHEQNVALKSIDLVILTHFHLDHCGALPLLYKHGYSGKVVMTSPTKSILPFVLEDYYKLNITDYNEDDINILMENIETMDVGMVKWIDNIGIRVFNAGHVLGAAMFYVKVEDESLLYTGDYTTGGDLHLDGCFVNTRDFLIFNETKTEGQTSHEKDGLSISEEPSFDNDRHAHIYMKDINKHKKNAYNHMRRPNLLITECTYGSVDRESRKSRTRSLVTAVMRCVQRNGKVLIPVFAIGRAQEIYIMLSTFFKKMNVNVQFYYCSTIIDRGLKIYSRFDDYTKQALHFDFSDIHAFKNDYLVSDQPFIVFSSPGMLHTGNSLKIFKALCEDERNLVIIPGYCMKNTLAEKLSNGIRKVMFEREYNIKMEVKNIGFSAHADSSGILRFIAKIMPYNIMLVHGDKNRMTKFKKIVENMCWHNKNFILKHNVFMPHNGSLLNLKNDDKIVLESNDKLTEKHLLLKFKKKSDRLVITSASKYIKKNYE